MALGRIQRWALTLSSHKYELKYRHGKYQGNCDAFSELSLTVPIPGDILLFADQLSSSPVTTNKIRIMTKVLHFVLHGWPLTKVKEELRPYYMRRNELTYLDGCLLWRSRVVIPTQA